MVVVYAYLQNSTSTAWDVLMAFVRQIVQTTTSMAVLALVEALFNTYRHQDTLPTVDELAKLLKDMLDHYEEQVVSIDALDEMEIQEQTVLMNVIVTLKARIIVFSRRHTLESAQVWMKNFRPAYLEITADERDIDIHITHGIDNTPNFEALLLKYSLREDVVKTVKEKAGGM